ncbi:hypothetical protein BBP40_005073 [Aspergillus hancockii]|nr:hypothetical protein BBP40_005073 [Aspergillus hancockii]
MFSKTFFAAAMLGASAVEAHMMLKQPVPYGKDSLNNSPLEADGSDFPCKLRSNTFQVTEENTAAVGQSMPLSFIGSATHGGGSCQVSLTTDREPTKNSKWMVIKSIEGGCPANVEGNMAGGPASEGAATFNYTIPDGIAPGKYTLAWTWFNRIGNREMYMNCAPLTVTGGSSKRDEVPVEESEAEEEKDVQAIEKRAASFPPMFVANVNGCITKEGVDIRFPNPGSEVTYGGSPGNLSPEGSSACTGNPTFGADGISAGAGGSSPAPPSSSAAGGSAPTGGVTVPAPVASSTLIPKPSQSSAPGIFVPTNEPAKPTTTAPSQPPAQPSSGSSSSSSSGAQTGSCSTEGSWNCIGGSSFQRCAGGIWTPVQQMAAGTECTSGLTAELQIKSAGVKPRMLHEMRHRRRDYSHHHA